MKIFVTGSAGFIGFHLSKTLLEAGHEVFGFDALSDYYDVALKEARHDILKGYSGFQARIGRLEDYEALEDAYLEAKPEIVIHLAAQAGVRYSYEQPRDYVTSNIIGSFNLLELMRISAPKHALFASTSSVFGANTQMPYREDAKADLQVSTYAATKKSQEAISHVYAHLHGMPITQFRFFTVYGSWGRPDMAPIKFARLIDQGQPIEVYNNGQLSRDFTHINDLVRAILLLIDVVPTGPDARGDQIEGDTLSPVAPYRVVNIGNSEPVQLLDFIEALEGALGTKAERIMSPMQPGDVYHTWADASLLQRLTGYRPETSLESGIEEFIDWYKSYYR